MNKYYINTNSNTRGFLEVHKESCMFLPNRLDVKFLGMFPNESEAIKSYPKAISCRYCVEKDPIKENTLVR